MNIFTWWMSLAPIICSAWSASQQDSRTVFQTSHYILVPKQQQEAIFEPEPSYQKDLISWFETDVQP